MNNRNRPAKQAAFRPLRIKIGITSHTKYRRIHRPSSIVAHFHNLQQPAWPEGRSARRGNGLRNYECFPSSQKRPQRKRLTWKGKLAHSESVPPGKGNSPAAKAPTRAGNLSLILSIVQSHVYYEKHTSNLLTLKPNSVIFRSS